jgi:hypothetical protein
MPLHQTCIPTLISTGAEIWVFVNSGEGQLLITLTLGAHAFAGRVRRLPGIESKDFANTLMVAIICGLFILANERKIYSHFKDRVSQCTGDGLTAGISHKPAGGQSGRPGVPPPDKLGPWPQIDFPISLNL